MAQQDKKRLSADTRRKLKEPEGVEVDFKEKHTAIKSEDLVSFANSRGGIIFVGVTESVGTDGRQCGEVVGCDISDGARVSIINKATQCTPIVEVNVVVENVSTKKPIIRVEISEGNDKPYGTSGGVYKRRVGARNVSIDSSLMKTLVLESESEEFIRRFKAAGDEIVKAVEEAHSSLLEAVESVEGAAHEAADAAHEATAAAEEAAGY